MKKATLFLFLFFSLFQAFAQETVASEPKTLQQLYLSAGTGPGFTFNQEAKTTGLNFNSAITWAIRPNRLNQLGLNVTGFKDINRPKNDEFRDLLGNDYTIISPSFSLGRRKEINDDFYFQAFTGASLNVISEFSYISPEQAADGLEQCFPSLSLSPGLLLQAEALKTPSRFIGFSFGFYYHLMTRYSNGGLTLKFNLGLLK